MADSGDDRLKDVATLTRAIENVFRKLIRFLVGRISLVRLQEMVRSIFVEEAEFLLRSGNPTREMSLADLALITGLDTRTITKIRKGVSYRTPFSERDAFLVDLNPGSSVIDIWSTQEPFFDSKRGVPRELDISGTPLSFETLFNENIAARGVTASSLLTRLINSGSVGINQNKDRVQLLNYSYFPFDTADQVGAIEMGFSAVSDFLDTLFHNLTTASSPEEKHFQRGSWSLKVPKANIGRVKAELIALLQKTDLEAKRIIRKHEIGESQSDTEYMKSGVGYYYFEGRSLSLKKHGEKTSNIGKRKLRH